MLKYNFNSGINFLKNDRYFGLLIKEIEPPLFPQKKTYNEYFQSLAKYIIYQQLSIKSAQKIYMRFLSLFNKNKINTKNFKKITYSELIQIGISKSKIKYIDNVAERFIKDKNFLKNITSMSDNQIISNLIDIKGVGPWTADMFLMFTLCRFDVFPIKDLGIKKGMQKLFKLDMLPTDSFMIKKSKNWSPYRTICCLYLWKLIDENNFEW